MLTCGVGRQACLQLFMRPAGDHTLFSESTAQSDTHGGDFSSWQEARRTRWLLMPAVALKWVLLQVVVHMLCCGLSPGYPAQAAAEEATQLEI